MFDDLPISVRKVHNGDLKQFNDASYWMVGNKAYIGRGSPLGNPYSSKPSKYAVTYVDTSEEAVERFRSDLYGRRLSPEAYEAMGELILHSKNNPLDLLCYCHDPNKCHGSVIREFIQTKGGKR
ncbi:hypothetical protein BJD49_gp015 [Acinetobacter phage vB_AbaM_phiAbaA1]|uniref:hypothetical protein n=1 Tax=Acinetobacter phage vB_AbaM_phiAbaA1 TaxID=1605379 RepID=UPI00078DCA81|nr:hypothetical protein BJD49_gp015 [Acinetobacter phage vB_AbaM_phiAbaA1]AJK27118.1 hypothetical protein phiAbaA1_015 [Acinetobacter phage vB_AbaM_phiAbaA1]